MSYLSPSRSLVLCLAACAVLCAPPRDARGQIARGGGNDSQSSGPLDLLRQQMRTTGTGSSVPQEGPVDPDEYIVGPGDQFSISISTLQTIAAVLPVSADGSLTLPDAGIVHVAGVTLAEAVETALSKLRERFSNVEVSISLSAPRQFYVHVVGAVSAPGRYLVAPVSRVSDALLMAYADTSRTPVANPDFEPSFRNVAVHRRDGARLSADLMAYFTTGDKNHNPYLRDGDVISVPAFDAARQSVSVSGQVPFPGTYDLREGESVRDIVAVSSGVPVAELRGAARVTRRSASALVDEVVSLDDGGGSDFPLMARDHVFVLPADDDRGFAHVEGRVHYPGSYPIEQGITTVDDLIRMAGGLHEDALRRGAFLVRRSEMDETRLRRLADGARVGPTGTMSGGVVLEPPSATDALSTPTSEALRTMRLSDLDFMNRSYLAQELTLSGRIPVDLSADLGTMILVDGDRLQVPRNDGTVHVFGQVVRPGYVPYREGATTGDYVRDSGGPGPEANALYRVEAGTLRFREGSSLPLQSGDMVFVSRSSETADSAELRRIALEDRRYLLDSKRLRAEARGRTLSAVLQGVSAVATVAALIITIRNN